jgi:hypothetical protein
MAGQARRFTTLPQRPPGKLSVNRWTAATRPGYLPGVRVGVALGRVCFMKNAGLVIRQQKHQATPTTAGPPSPGRRGRSAPGPGGRVETGKEMFPSQLTRSARSVVEAARPAEPAGAPARGRGAPMGRQRASEARMFSCWRERRTPTARRRAVSVHPERARTGPRSAVIAITSLW